MHTAITFKNLQAGIADMIVADLQDSAEGFEETDGELKVVFLAENFHQEQVDALARHYQLHYDQEEIAPQNWNALWESNFNPVIVDDFVGIRASFHDPLPEVAHEIVITPKMSFGTGHHATTHLVIQQMEKIDFTGKSVFDFGTGTGVLAILAQKLGAAVVYANDIDEWSIVNAKENFEQNHAAGIQLVQSDNAVMDRKFDVILANINRNILLDNMENLSGQLTANAQLILSGILEEDLDTIEQTAASYQLHLTASSIRNKWLCLLFTKSK